MSGDDHVNASPRMLQCLVLSLLVMALAIYVQSEWPGSLAAVTLYKAHLMALGGWGGYWLDRWLFPYDRPHTYLLDDEPTPGDPIEGTYVPVGSSFSLATLRRAVIVAACLICVGLGA